MLGAAGSNGCAVTTTATLSYITISGLNEVNENSGTQYTCTAYYSNGNNSNVTGSASWDQNSGYAMISSNGGFLTTLSVSSDQSFTITATYLGKTSTYSVTIKNILQDAGSIRVSIVPQEAAEAGGQWRVLGENIWRNSSTSKSNLQFGTYTIEFKNVQGGLHLQTNQLPSPLSSQILGSTVTRISLLFKHTL